MKDFNKYVIKFARFLQSLLVIAIGLLRCFTNHPSIPRSDSAFPITAFTIDQRK
ncbi:hypothetical protein IMAU60066_01352 [Lactobacillus helveticus]|nr:hypothetical protein [Lactobacillus helveticus]